MKTAFDFLQSNGIVSNRETGVEVINNPNYYGLLHAMNEFAVYYAKNIFDDKEKRNGVIQECIEVIKNNPEVMDNDDQTTVIKELEKLKS